jgi:hypothetical protein
MLLSLLPLVVIVVVVSLFVNCFVVHDARSGTLARGGGRFARREHTGVWSGGRAARTRVAATGTTAAADVRLAFAVLPAAREAASLARILVLLLVAVFAATAVVG